MRNILLSFILLIMFFADNLYCESKNADFAGSWYPSNSQELSSMLNGFIAQAEKKEVNGEILGLISPHAGFVYSGPVAAYGYKLIQGKIINTAIIVGFNHRFGHEGIAVCDYDSYKTPLGEVPIDVELSNKIIMQNKKIYSLKKAFNNENSTEMQVPFLQTAISGFKLVIIQMGEQSLENCKILADALSEVLKGRDDFILIASTDMCHYLPYETANEMDSSTISIIKSFDPVNFYTESSLKSHALMCGYGAVCAVMTACKILGADEIALLKYANSGDTAFDKRSVVGYMSAAFIKNKKLESEIKNPNEEDNNMLNESERKKLLELARNTITSYLMNRKKLSIKEDDPILNKEMGAFVTLHKHGELRGCIGNMVGRGPLYLTIRDMAIAATGDSRFMPVTPDEMKDIDIEISVLSPLEKIDDPNIIVPGKHGVIVRDSFNSGVYLPQVATETGWSREQFMNSLCGSKAGMSPDAWKKGKCEIYIFTAEVFGEKG